MDIEKAMRGAWQNIMTYLASHGFSLALSFIAKAVKDLCPSTAISSQIHK